MSELERALAEVVRVLKSGDDFLVASHAGPDGDAIGSLSAVGELLDGLGKRNTLYNTDGVPETLKFLPHCQRVVSDLPNKNAKWAILLDCSTPDRISDAFNRQRPFEKSLILDHHLTERDFGDVAYVDSSAAATGEVIYRLAKALDWQPTPAFATAVYTAVSTDTGSFQFSNTNARVLAMASELAEWGADPAEIADRVYSTQSQARVAMMKSALEHLTYLADGRVAIVTIWQRELNRAGASKYDLEGLVNIPRSIRGVQIAVQIREVIPGKEFRLSLRCKKGCNVEQIASKFGGGGHKHAAGCTIYGNYDEVKAQVFPLLEKAAVKA